MSDATEKVVGGVRPGMIFASVALVLSLSLVALDRLFLPDRFLINEVVVLGDAPNVDPAAVLAAVRELGPRSWFSLDLEEVEQAVGAVAWVDRASVRRRWPATLVVSVAQAEPVARWNDSDWLDQAGERLTIPRQYAGDGLPRLYGAAGSEAEVVERYGEFRAQFEAAGRMPPVTVEKDSRGVWIVGIDAGGDRTVPVVVGRDDQAPRLRRLLGALDSGLDRMLGEIERVDLRYPNGFSVRPAAGAGQVVDRDSGRPRGTG